MDETHLVEGREPSPVPPDPADLAQCLFKRCAKGYGAVL